MDLSIVIPVYNERESLPHLQARILDEMGELDYAWELIYVDDGSTDGSTELLIELQSDYENIIAVVLRGNRGKSQALDAGFALTRGTTIITMDADLQDEPAEIPNLLAKLDQGFDVVVGWKQVRHDPLSKRFFSQIANGVTRFVSGLQLNDMNSGLKAMRATCVHQLNIYGDLHRYIPIIAHYEGFRVTEIPVIHHPRQYGQSKYGPGRLLRGGFDLLTVVFLHKFRYRPLHLFGGIGGLLFGLGILINLYLTVEWFQGVRPIGDRPLLTLGVLLMVIGGQLISTGLIAELLVAHMRQREDPLQVVRAVYGKDIVPAKSSRYTVFTDRG